MEEIRDSQPSIPPLLSSSSPLSLLRSSLPSLFRAFLSGDQPIFYANSKPVSQDAEVRSFVYAL